jgi:hypothetical protein
MGRALCQYRRDEEAWVLGWTERMSNLNEAKTNELRYTERSSNADNQKRSGYVGALILKRVSDGEPTAEEKTKFTPDGKLCGKFADFSCIFGASYATIAAVEGQCKVEDAKALVGRLVTFRHWNPNRDEIPRFPQLVTWRDEDEIEKG